MTTYLRADVVYCILFGVQSDQSPRVVVFYESDSLSVRAAMDSTIIPEEFTKAAKEFENISNKLHDEWKLFEDKNLYKCYLKKHSFIDTGGSLLKAEYVVFFHMSYGVPCFSFSVWDSSGALLSLEDIRQMGVAQINQMDFYSVITQQEHPIFFRPYFIVHPCHTEALLSTFKDRTKNIIVTFLGLITPLIKLDLRFEYGL